MTAFLWAHFFINHSILQKLSICYWWYIVYWAQWWAIILWAMKRPTSSPEKMHNGKNFQTGAYTQAIDYTLLELPLSLTVKFWGCSQDIRIIYPNPVPAQPNVSQESHLQSCDYWLIMEGALDQCQEELLDHFLGNLFSHRLMRFCNSSTNYACFILESLLNPSKMGRRSKWRSGCTSSTFFLLER